MSSVVDTTSIKVGEQFSYKIIIESDNFQEINFPETFNFSPFTIADEFPSDTNYLKSKKIISKKFNLTHFDQGSFSINPQKLDIGDKIYTTEKIDIDVLTIKVDNHQEGPSVMMRAKTKNDEYSTDSSDRLASKELIN